MIELARGDDRLMQLLADKTTEGLSWLQQDELEHLFAVHPEVGPEELELAAATATLAMNGSSIHHLPQPIRAELLSNASGFFSRKIGASIAPSRPNLRTYWNDQDYL